MSQNHSISWGHFLDPSEESGVQSDIQVTNDELQTLLSELKLEPKDEYNLELLDNVRPVKWNEPVPHDTYNIVVIGAGVGGLVTAAGF